MHGRNRIIAGSCLGASWFLSTDLQSAFWEYFEQSPSVDFPIDLTSLHALLTDQTGGVLAVDPLRATRIHAAKYLHPYLTDGLGEIVEPSRALTGIMNVSKRPRNWPSSRQLSRV